MTSEDRSSYTSFSLEKYLKDIRPVIERRLSELLPPSGEGHPVLREAMRYSLLAPGKRFRPILALASCEAVGGSRKDALDPACAVEFIHAYSLIHDDLPAMDDAELRRGNPTCHRHYGEAMGILAGDGLLTEAWGVISRWSAGFDDRARVALRLIDELARGAGVSGMVSGQAYDMDEDGPANIVALDALHALKTGALISAATRIGAICGGADEISLKKLTGYAEAVGLAFQVIDDVLDVEGMDTGKDRGTDSALGKKSYPVFTGIDGAREKASALIEKAVGSLKGLSGPIEPLEAIALYAIERKK